MLRSYWRKEQRDFFFWQPLMVKDDGHHVLHDIPLVGEYEDVFEALKWLSLARGHAPMLSWNRGHYRLTSSIQSSPSRYG